MTQTLGRGQEGAGGWAVDLVRQEGWWSAVPTGCPGRPRPLEGST